MEKLRFVLMRHGQTEWNTKGMFQGSTDMPLDAVGRKQTAAAAAWMAHMKPVAIWSSPKQRALAAAQSVATLTGQDVVIDERLAEVDYGDFEGKTWQQAIALDPDVANWRDGKADVHWPGGDSGADVMARMVEVLNDIDRSEPQGVVLVCGHGSAIRLALGGLFGWEYPQVWKLSSIDNCNYVEVIQEFGTWRLKRFDVTPLWNFSD